MASGSYSLSKEKTPTVLCRGECIALIPADIDRATRDPRTLEDQIDAVDQTLRGGPSGGIFPSATHSMTTSIAATVSLVIKSRTTTATLQINQVLSSEVPRQALLAASRAVREFGSISANSSFAAYVMHRSTIVCK